ncbi:MAG: flagellar assembly peptidoglycan hydrolase FlgJ [Comamonadaceae bacterium]
MISSGTTSANLALDARGLDALRLQAKQNPDKALKGVAQQFEAVFLQTLLKSMRDATPQDGMMDSDQTRMYTSMLDQQMAQSLSARGIGLAEVMLRQLSHSPVTPSSTQAQTGATPQSTVGVTANSFLPGATDTGTPDPSQNFLSRMKEHALNASNLTGIPAKFLLGHAALESGWGKHEIRAADGSSSHNLFGVKAGRNWKGATVEASTTEYVDGVPNKSVQKFRAYASYAQAFQDYANLLKTNPRYGAVLKPGDGAAFAQGLQRAGYATDPRYAEKLTQVLNGARMRRTMLA